MHAVLRVSSFDQERLAPRDREVSAPGRLARRGFSWGAGPDTPWAAGPGQWPPCECWIGPEIGGRRLFGA
jgi:hypothetical protein